MSLQATNETIIKTYGEQFLTLDPGLRRRFTWIFIVAQAKQPILGADFLSAYNVLVDMSIEKLIDENIRLHVDGTNTTNCEIHGVRIIKLMNKVLTDILSKYKCITRVDYQKEYTLHHT